MQEEEKRPDLAALVSAATSDAKGWLNAQRAYLTLYATEKGGRMIGKFVVLLILVILMVGVVFLCTIALALWFGREYNDNVLGFLAAAGCLLVASLLLHFIMGKSLRNYITLTMINAADEREE